MLGAIGELSASWLTGLSSTSTSWLTVNGGLDRAELPLAGISGGGLPDGIEPACGGLSGRGLDILERSGILVTSGARREAELAERWPPIDNGRNCERFMGGSIFRILR